MLTEPNKFKFIDLFAGIGGLRMPFSKFGDCVFTSEKDKYARETYRANFPNDRHSINEDITKIDPSDIPDHDFLIGGFPCQPFSKAGLRQGFDDKRERGTLFFNIVEILREKRPKMFLLENVATLRTQNKGLIFQRILDELGHTSTLFGQRNDLDYHVVAVTLNSRQFGVPQNRNRVFLIGMERTKTTISQRALIEEQVTNLETRKFDAETMSTILMDEPEIGEKEDYIISKKLWASHKRRKKENLKNGKGFGYSVFTTADNYCRTMSARYYKDGSEILIGSEGSHMNTCPRLLYRREAARLQGFPDSFIIDRVSRTQIYKQFGNSVCVPLIESIAEKLTPTLCELVDKNDTAFQKSNRYVA